MAITQWLADEPIGDHRPCLGRRDHVARHELRVEARKLAQGRARDQEQPTIVSSANVHLGRLAGTEPDRDRQPSAALFVLAEPTNRERARGRSTTRRRQIFVNRTPVSDHGIADDLGNVATVLPNEIDDLAQKLIERTRQLLNRGRPAANGRRGDRREARDIDQQQRRRSALSMRLVRHGRGRGEIAQHGLRDIARKRADFDPRPSVPRPHETPYVNPLPARAPRLRLERDSTTR